MSCWEIVVAGVCALVVAATTPTILRHLPEPAATAEDGTAKPCYRRLATVRTALMVGALSLTAGLWSAWRADLALFLATSTLLALAIVVDAATTYLPRRLCHGAWLVTGVGVLAHAGLVGDPSTIVRALAGATAGTLVMLAAWRWCGVGFGDVRLMGALTAATTAQQWSLLYPTLLAATCVGALSGLAFRAAGRRGVFPYGPGLWLGSLVALWWA